MSEPEPEPIEPVPTPDDPFAIRAVRIDAPLAVKRGTTLGASVRLPGDAETVAAAPAGPRTAVPGAHNWVPIGPRNVGGRIRAVAIHPVDRQVMYAAPASGGVYKSLDGAESWFPLWHDEPSLSMAALSICRDHPEVVWAATGESDQARANQAPLPTAGVLRSTDGGVTWGPPPAGPIRRDLLHAVAAHPAQRDVCWAVGRRGVYRTTDGGASWTQFARDRAFSDVAYARFGGTLRLFLVPSGSSLVAGPPGPAESRRGVVVRIDDPDASDATIAGILPAGIPPGVGNDPLLPRAGVTPPPAAGAVDPADGKLAIHEDAAGGGAGAVLYVAFADTDSHVNGIFRCRNPNAAAATGMTFTALVVAASFRNENQGEYNLALAVSPADPNHLAFGMQALYLNRNANASPSRAQHWLLAQMDDLYHLERGHHADHHALVFAEVPDDPFRGDVPGGTLLLWDANDGGLSVSADWATGASYAAPPLPATLPDAALPLAAGAMTWRKRSHGISATQMYDLTQHPRLPAVLGCGFQDNGAWIGTGGPSWQFVLSADGGFVAFDPDDPYRIIATYQDGITDCRFPGLLRDALPLLRDGVLAGFWPRELTDGFLTCDRVEFLAPTYFHPTSPGRVFTARRNRLYGTRRTTGDRWQPEPLGHGIEILHEPTSTGAASSSIEVLDTPGGRALGLLAQRSTTETREDGRRISRVRTLVGEPFAIPNGQVLSLNLSNDSATGAARRVDVPLTVGADLPAAASAGQLARYLTAQIGRLLQATPAANRPVVTVLPLLWRRSGSLFVVSEDAGRARRITVGGDAAPLLGVPSREYTGADAQGAAAALPALVEIEIVDEMAGHPGRGLDLSGKRLVLGREGGTHPVTIDFDAHAPNAARVRLADLADILRARLPAAGYRVLAGAGILGVRLTATAAGASVTLDGNLVADLAADEGLDPGATGRTVRINRRNRFDLQQAGSPLADRTLRVAEAGHRTAQQALNPAFLGLADLSSVTSVELCDAIRRMLAAAPTVRVRCDLDVYPSHTLAPMFESSAESVVRELAFGPDGSRRIWAGDESGRLYRSTDDGDTWVGVPRFPPADRFGVVEAIAMHPERPDTVLAGVFTIGTFDPTVSLLFRTDNGGADWAPVGQGIESAGKRIGISAIAVDRVDPFQVFVGTEAGVFRSVDFGSTFAPFNQGLPNAPVVDLAFEPTTRMLRVGLWGRGVYERHVGDRPPRDVRLHIRSTALDDGSAQPYPGPDLLATSPAPLRLDASPDVKQIRRDPRRGLLLDGVEFDDELRHEDVREGAAFIAVQVHNRGAFPTSTARVAVLWAPADAGPPPLGGGLASALAAGPLAVNARFGEWTVVADDLLADPHAIGHAVVAAGYPRVAVIGAPPRGFAWGPEVSGHARVGLLVLCRCTEDPLGLSTTDVLELVRTEAKAAYRECAVVRAAEDGRIVLRATETNGFRIQAPTPASVANLANGAAPLGLALAPAGSREAVFDRPEPYDLSGAVSGFRLTIDHDLTIRFTAGEEFRNPRLANADEVAAVINRELVAAGVPLRASAGAFGNGSLAVFLTRLGAATFSAAGTAATRLGLTTGQGTITKFSTAGSAGPWDLRPLPSARELRLVVRTPVEVRLGPGIPGLPVPANTTGAEVRAAINRQLRIGGADGVEAAPRRLGLSVRRSASEAAPTRVVAGSYALADVVASAAQVATPAERLARLRAVAAQDHDLVTAGQQNFLYARAANLGTIRAAPGRVRVFELAVAADGTVTRSDVGAVDQALAPAESAVVEIPFALDARPSGSRLFALAVADTAAEPLDPPATFPSLDDAHRFCLDHAGAAIRELVVR